MSRHSGRPRGAWLAVAAAGCLLTATACGGTDAATGGPAPPSSSGEDGISRSDLPADAVEVMARNLDTPWELRFLPGGDLLVTERGGFLLRLSPDAGDGVPYGVAEEHEVSGVREAGEAGLMGLALHPAYPDPPWIYVCHTYEGAGDLRNRVVRFDYADGELSGHEVLLDGIPGSAIHDGCRLEFGPDGFLYASTGDAGDGGQAQDRGSLAGKIHRLTDAGEPAPDNPFGTTVFTLGHRNPQGLAFDAGGRLWATEHGPSGMRSGQDEVNRIRLGANYGWPEITGDGTREGMEPPVMHSGASTWAPSGLAASEGSLFFAGLRGAALYELRGAVGDGGEPRLLAHFRGEYGRLRAVRTGPDGLLWFGTSNRDGRGSPAPEDDRLLSVDPAALSTPPR